MSLDAYLASFGAPEGYLNFASYGPPSAEVERTVGRLVASAVRGEPASGLHAEDARAIAAVSRLSGFDESAIALSPSTSHGLLQTAFGMPRGEVLLSRDEFPANLYPWWRARDTGLIGVRELPGAPLSPVTADRVAAAITDDTVAVAVSAVDFRTGYRADLAALREAVGDRLLVVDGIQGFGTVEQDWTLADVLIVGGQKWLRAGWGTGFLAFSPRGLDRVSPTLGSWTGVEEPTHYDGEQHPLAAGAKRFSATNGSPFASGALATALEQLESAGVATVAGRVAEASGLLLTALDDAGVPVLSPREPAERGGIVVAGVADAASALARLAAAGITATAHGTDRIRFSVHATTTPAAVEAAADLVKETA